MAIILSNFPPGAPNFLEKLAVLRYVVRHCDLITTHYKFMNFRSFASRIAIPAMLFSFAAACDTGQENDGANESKPNPADNGVVISTSAKTTGNTILTNITEIGLFDGAGRVSCLVIDRTDSNHLIAGAATGGLWTSSNRGKTWTPIDDHLPTLNIRSLTQNPLQTNTWYASTYTLMRTGPNQTDTRPDIYKSTDGGQTFQLVPATAGTFSLVLKVVCSPIDQNTVYAIADGFGGTRGVYRSTNNAQSFTHVFPISTEVNDLEILPDGSLLVTAGTEVYRSPNGNPGTYTLSVNGLNGSNTFTAIDLAFCQSQPNHIYGITTGGNSGVGVFRSTNGGQNWSFLQSLNSGVFTRAIGVKPNNPAFFFAGSVGMYLSQTSGNAFSYYPVGGVDYWSVNFDPHNPDKVIITFDQGVTEINLNPFNPDPYTAFVRRDSLLNCAQIYAGDYFATGDRVVIGMQDLGTVQAWVGGTRNVQGYDGGYCYFHKQDSTVIYGSIQNAGLFKKVNQHIPFPQPGYTNPIDILNQLDADNDGDVDEGSYFIHPFWVNDADGEQLYFPTRKRLWRSTDGGDNWTPISSVYWLTAPGSAQIEIEGNHKSNPIIYWTVRDTLWVMTNAKTATAGNEIKIKLPDNVQNIRRDPTNDSIIFLTTHQLITGPRIYRSSNLFNGNVQWTDLTGNLPDNISVRCVEVNPDDKDQMIAGTSAGLYVSSDGGIHWEKELQFPSVGILRTSMRPSDKRLFIFTYGRGAWAASFPASNKVSEIPGRIKLAVWPNPSTDIIHVGVPEISKHTVIQVVSMDGKVVRTASNLQHTPHAISIRDLPAATYLVIMKEGNRQTGIGRVVKQ